MPARTAREPDALRRSRGPGGRSSRSRRAKQHASLADRTRSLADQLLDDDAVAPLAVELPVAFVDSDLPESDGSHEREARRVVDEDPRHELPAAPRDPGVLERRERDPGHASTASGSCDVHGELGDPVVERAPGPVRRGGRVAEHLLPVGDDDDRVLVREPAQDGVGRRVLGHEGRGPSVDALVVDRSDRGCIVSHGLPGADRHRDSIASMWDVLLTRREGRVVVLEPLREAHVDALWEAGRDERLWRWFPIAPGDEDAFRRYHAHLLTETARGECAAFATLDAESGTPVGSTSFLALRQEHRGLEIGSTWLTPRLWGTGANAEAKYLQLRHAFETLACMRVEFKTDARNE